VSGLNLVLNKLSLSVLTHSSLVTRLTGSVNDFRRKTSGSRSLARRPYLGPLYKTWSTGDENEA
jgi:hypothetical protein